MFVTVLSETEAYIINLIVCYLSNGHAGCVRMNQSFRRVCQVSEMQHAVQRVRLFPSAGLLWRRFASLSSIQDGAFFARQENGF